MVSLFGRPNGFTLLELLSVMAIMAVLAGLLIPTTTAVRNSALRIRGKTQFKQWGLALEEFRSEYGHYPQISVSGIMDTSRFLGALTGRDHQGLTATGPAAAGNTRGLRFYTLSTGELLGSEEGAPRAELKDAFGNSRIGVLIDWDGDGFISGDEYVLQALPAGNSHVGFSSPIAPPRLGEAVRISARVAFYSAGAGRGSEDYLCSWYD